MTGLDLLLAIAGFTVTVLVVVGMILITPRGQVRVDADDPQAPDLSPTREVGTVRPDPARATM